MNVLMLCGPIEIGGVTKVCIDLSNQLTVMGHKVVVLGKIYRGGAEKKFNKNVTVYDIDLRNHKFALNIKSLLYICRKEGIDIIHCHWRKTALYAEIIKRILGIDYVWQNHLIPIPADFIHRKFTFIGKKAIAISPNGCEFLEDKLKIKPENIYLLCNGIDMSAYKSNDYFDKVSIKARYGINNDVKVVTLLGRLAPVKGHSFLLEAMKSCKEKNWNLILTGDGESAYKNEIMQKVHEFGLDNKVIFTGTVDAKTILSVSDVMVLPSIQEGFPISVLEAVAMKVPVIRTNTGGAELFKDCIDIIEYGDVKGLAKVIDRNLKTVNMSKINKAYEKCKDYDIANIANKLLQIYES